MNKKKYTTPSIVVRTTKFLVSPICLSEGTMKTTGGFFDSGSFESSIELNSAGFDIAGNDKNDGSFGNIGGFGHGLWN